MPLTPRSARARERRARLGRAVGARGEPLLLQIEPDGLPELLGGWRPVHAADPFGTPLRETTSGVVFVRAEA